MCRSSLVTERDPRRQRAIMSVVCLALGLLLPGCISVPVYQQDLVSQPGMLFSDSPLLVPEAALLTQVEPGTASNGGGQAAGCSSCR
jgi:hypothetical protein